MRNVFARFQRQMVFPGPEGVSVSLLNEVAGKVGATELRIATEDGETLYGWHRAAVWSGPRRVVLYFHGNASSLLAQIELHAKHGTYEKKVYTLPKELDEEVARLHLDKLGAKLTTLSAEQAAYIGVPVKGPYKPDHYRY